MQDVNKVIAVFKIKIEDNTEIKEAKKCFLESTAFQ